MFDSADVAAHVYDIATRRFGRPRHEMSFPEIKTEAEAEFIKQKNINIRWMDEKSEEEKKKQAIHIGLDDSGAATREAEQKKKAVKKEDDAGPSTVIPIESDSSGRDDSEKEDGECDDPRKDEF
ncbi:uncharacterized protein [Aegilops tauschii subsp. strangulata]|uniref:uncharacterized protein n=1 Tax=Aegilops tauschii subsp. strangulata TaxID=200361 RepID=UPI003CC8DAF4